MDGGNRPDIIEWENAAWAIQSWVRSCYDVHGRCLICGSYDPEHHVNNCPWPQTRKLLDRSMLWQIGIELS